MSTFVLVHGAWHGAWCWHKMVPMLAAKGHKVITPDLPGLGDDPTPLKEISFKSYTDKVGSIIEKQDEQVVLVGHSMGGMVITQLAEYFPEKIKSLVYLTAFLPCNGEFLLYLAEKLPDGLVNPNMILSDDKLSAGLKEDIVFPAFYSDCNELDQAMAKAKLVSQATAPLTQAVRISQEKFGSVPKTYITCSQDVALPLEAQEMMLKATPCDQVFNLETSHSPFLSEPEKLAKLLLSI